MLSNLLCIVDIEAHKIYQTKKKKDRLGSENQEQSFTDDFQYICSFASFTGKCLCWSLFLIKLLVFHFIKRDSNTVVFLRNF